VAVGEMRCECTFSTICCPYH